MAKFSVWRVILAGILFAVLGQIVNTLSAFLTMSYYTNPAYFALWSKIMMPGPGAPPSSFYLYSILFAIIIGILVALVYGVLKNSVPGKMIAKKGLNYGLLVFLVGGIPGYLMMLLIINLPAGLVLSWAFSSLIIDLIGGMIIAWIMR